MNLGKSKRRQENYTQDFIKSWVILVIKVSVLPIYRALEVYFSRNYVDFGHCGR